MTECRNGVSSCLGVATHINRNVVYLKVVVEKQVRSFYFSYDNQAWDLVGRVADASFPSDESVQFGKHHTGTMVGMYATNGGNGNRLPADFDWFHYEF